MSLKKQSSTIGIPEDVVWILANIDYSMPMKIPLLYQIVEKKNFKVWEEKKKLDLRIRITSQSPPVLRKFHLIL